jgi:hypothetical protein
VHAAIEDPTHLRLTKDRRLHVTVELEEAAVADHAAVALQLDGPRAHPDEGPHADAHQ